MKKSQVKAKKNSKNRPYEHENSVRKELYGFLLDVYPEVILKDDIIELSLNWNNVGFINWKAVVSNGDGFNLLAGMIDEGGIRTDFSQSFFDCDSERPIEAFDCLHMRGEWKIIPELAED